MQLFDRILAARGITNDTRASFLLPTYPSNHDPFLLPDMGKAVDRLVHAHKKQDKIVIYGDYDIDGLTAAALLFDSLKSFGFINVEVIIPNRFVEGYGLTINAIDKIVASKADLVVTVDCGSQSINEVVRANELGLDIIITDHHTVLSDLPPAIAVINPKRSDNKYEFIDLAGVGVAFKLIQALQTKLDGLTVDQSKWLLDLVALGTVCDIVPLKDENRINVYYGLKVLAKTRRPGLKALMAISAVEPDKISTRSLGFGLGPRMNASGRLETARHALDMLMAENIEDAFEKAQYLDELNSKRRKDQDKIFKEAMLQAEEYKNDSVLVVSGANWNHGIVGIVASKLLEKYKKPVFVLQEMGESSKGSARSFGDFNLAVAIESCRDVITKGGGHGLAAGINLPTKNIPVFRKRINDFYNSLNLKNQPALLLPIEDVVADFSEVNEELVNLINQLEPFGNGNPQPILRTDNLTVVNAKKMGSDNQHIKLELRDKNGRKMQLIAFSAPDYFDVKISSIVSAWYQPEINEWQSRRTVEGKLLHISCK